MNKCKPLPHLSKALRKCHEKHESRYALCGFQIHGPELVPSNTNMAQPVAGKVAAAQPLRYNASPATSRANIHSSARGATKKGFKNGNH